MNLSLEGKKAIVCGSTDGIGKATALTMAERGAEITLVARNEKKLAAALAELSAVHGQTHEIVYAEFNQPDELKREIENYLKQSCRDIQQPIDCRIWQKAMSGPRVFHRQISRNPGP